MEEAENRANNLSMSTLLWYSVFVWFASSLFSQSLYMGFNGVPYDALVLLEGLGPLYYAVLVVELLIWIGLGSLVLKKLVQKAGRVLTTPAAIA